MAASLAAEPSVKALRRAARDGAIPRGTVEDMAEEALNAGVISAEEVEIIKQAEGLRGEAIKVDAFSSAEYLENALSEKPESGLASTR
jgi:acyl-CoA dehydrogenase